MTVATAGWKKAKRSGSRKVSDAKLARDIVASIKAHAEAGTVKVAADYTSRVELIGMIEELLSR
jgi:hypothetical protein